MLTTLAPELEQCVPGQLEAAKLPYLKHVIRMGPVKSRNSNFDDVCAGASADDFSVLADLQGS